MGTSEVKDTVFKQINRKERKEGNVSKRALEKE